MSWRKAPPRHNSSAHYHKREEWVDAQLDPEEIIVALNIYINNLEPNFLGLTVRRVWSNQYRMKNGQITAVERRDRFPHPEYGLLDISYWGPGDPENRIQARAHCRHTR